MARVSATASLGMKVSLQELKKFGYTQFDNASPHHSITIERNYPDDMSDDFLTEKAEELHTMARQLVEKKINKDLKDLKKNVLQGDDK